MRCGGGGSGGVEDASVARELWSTSLGTDTGPCGMFVVLDSVSRSVLSL